MKFLSNDFAVHFWRAYVYREVAMLPRYMIHGTNFTEGADKSRWDLKTIKIGLSGPSGSDPKKIKIPPKRDCTQCALIFLTSRTIVCEHILTGQGRFLGLPWLLPFRPTDRRNFCNFHAFLTPICAPYPKNAALHNARITFRIHAHPQTNSSGARRVFFLTLLKGVSLK